jgi:hypothetical protein
VFIDDLPWSLTLLEMEGSGVGLQNGKL